MGAIEFSGVSLTFPNAKRATLRDCSLKVAAGEFVAILGPSGCGKTTLLKTVNRLYEPTAGTITLDGIDIGQLPVTQLRRRIGYVIQKAGLFPHMSVAENIAVVPKLLGWPRSRYQARTDELLYLVQLPPQEYRDRYPAQLSGGQQQRVGIARALAANPEVLLMDEPFGALDAITRASLQVEVAKLQSQLHKTILFVSHVVEEALLLADRILILCAGEIAQFDTPQNILLNPANVFVRDLVVAGDRERRL
ncbi:MAG: ATP-binding cassette domain-containing protein, partial [Cyanobacteria bacterium J06641_5]